MGLFGKKKNDEEYVEEPVEEESEGEGELNEEEMWDCPNCHKKFAPDDSFMRRTKIEKDCSLFEDACSKACVIATYEKDLRILRNFVEE